MPVTIDMTALDNLRALGPAGAQGLDRAVKRTAGKGRAVVIEEAAAEYKIPVADMGKAIQIPRGVPLFEGHIKVRGKRLPLIKFSAQPDQPFAGGMLPRGVSVDITGRKLVTQSKYHPGQMAFVARMGSGHVGIFQRRDVRGRLPKFKQLGKAIGTRTTLNIPGGRGLERIEEMFTVSPAQALSKAVYPRVEARLQRQLEIEATKEYGKAVRAIFKDAHTEWVWSEWAKR